MTAKALDTSMLISSTITRTADMTTQQQRQQQQQQQQQL
jgi:hypothetical protein